MSFLWSLISFIVVIGVLVSVHEYGHFWAARKCGIKVHRFSVGFGKVLWSKTDKRGTEFAVSAIPLGGYVKMLDERNETVPDELKSQSFNGKTVAQRAFVIAAGPIANFIFAVFAYWVIYLIGIPTLKPVIDEVEPDSIAARAQLAPNSQIIAVDGSATPDWETVNMILATKLGNAEVTMVVVPFGSDLRQEKRLNIKNWSFDPEKQSAFGSMGIVPVGNKVDMTVSKVVDDSPASRAGLAAGDKLIGLNHQPVSWRQFAESVQNSGGKSLSVTVVRDQEKLDFDLTPEKDGDRWLVGIAPTFVPVAPEYRTELKYGILESLQKGVEKTGQLSWITLKVLGKLLTGDLSLKNLSGPISIAKGAGMSSEIGLVYYLAFMALISVNLGIMNLFPLPVLDGGHLVFLAAEGITGKPISERIQEVAYRIGAILLLMLTAFALFNDFLRL